MSLTLRQLQKMFSAAERGDDVDNPYERELGRLGEFLTGNNRWRRASAGRDGSLQNNCTCAECRQAGKSLAGVRNIVDRWVREHGPRANLLEVIEDEKAAKQPQQGQGQGQGQSQKREQSAEGNGQSGQRGGQGNGQPSGNQTQTTGPASDSAGDDSPSTNPALPPKPALPEQTVNPNVAALEAAKKALQETLQSKGKNAAEKANQIRAAKKKMRMARRAVSFNATTEASGVSLLARRQVSRGLGRLGNVPQRLRARMADLINRLVEQGGTAGESFGPVPVLSATKLVKRMVVRRPLPNALKEDSIAGRPVTLFLPDISPSCAAQAQPACDLANAAGYAGVPGSDVLVLPHFNGGVDSGEEYIPWFNGKPAATNVTDARKLFEDVCTGQSCYRVKVVVFLGDHDAVERYGDIAQLKSVTRAVWLHNYSDRGMVAPVPAPAGLLPDWRPEAMAKLSMVSGCVDQPRMLKGFEIALNMR